VSTDLSLCGEQITVEIIGSEVYQFQDCLVYFVIAFPACFPWYHKIVRRTPENASLCHLSGSDISEIQAGLYIRSRFLGALLMMLSTRSSNSAASDAEETTALLSL
jgi:hypothetical protein